MSVLKIRICETNISNLKNYSSIELCYYKQMKLSGKNTYKISTFEIPVTYHILNYLSSFKLQILENRLKLFITDLKFKYDW